MAKKQAQSQVANEVMNEVVGMQELETVETTTVVNNNSNLYESLEWLQANAENPTFPAELTSKKCKLDREPMVQLGLSVIKQNENVSKLFVLLCIWWENKAARKTIKTALDDEALALGYEPNDYLQVCIRKTVMPYDALQDAVNRMKYAITYFKPREGAKIKETLRQVSIGGTIYNVPLSLLTHAKEQFGSDREAIKDFLLSSDRCRPVENEIEEL